MIRAIFFIFFNFFWTGLCSLTAIASGMRDPFSVTAGRVLKLWAQGLTWACGARVEVKGLQNIVPGTQYVVVANHRSHLDTPILVSCLPFRVTIIAKTELFKIPFFGAAMHGVGILEIDRRNRERAVKTMKKAGDVLRKQGLSVLIFPEGTRGKGSILLPLKRGAFVLAAEEHLPILPVTIVGTEAMLPRSHAFVQPGSVTVIVHPPEKEPTQVREVIESAL